MDFAVQMYRRLALRPGSDSSVERERKVFRSTHSGLTQDSSNPTQSQGRGHFAGRSADQADEDSSERGRALVQSAAGWHTEMARWVSGAKEAEAEEIDGDIEENNFPVIPIPPRLSQLRAPRKWQPITLKRLFAKTVKESRRARRGERMARRAQEEEEMYMQVMAALDAEDDTLDDGEVEIADDEVYGE
ncbi:hypothetical protein B0H10DRAFT_1960094 [Mycena sp. CBHHK59/15]|nr:hypothetical protein B0H10DRAFT_1960094 [Mycena sp. CBHHK59/15]